MPKIAIIILAALLMHNDAFCQHNNKWDNDHFQKTSYTDDGVKRVFSFYKEPIRISVSNDLLYAWYDNKVIHNSQGGYSGRLLDGSYTEYYPNRQLRSKGKYKNGVKHGLWKSWHSNGMLKSITHWRKGKVVGKRKIYNTQGELAKTQRFVHGMIKQPKKVNENNVKKSDLKKKIVKIKPSETGKKKEKPKRNNEKKKERNQKKHFLKKKKPKTENVKKVEKK